MCARTKVVIIDDDEKAIDSLSGMLMDYPEVEIVGTARAAGKGLALLKDLRPEVLFLDIELPDMNGMSLLDKINEEEIDVYIVMFTGKYAEHHNEVFSRNEHDYLLKPVLPQELDKVLKRYRHYDFANKPRIPLIQTLQMKSDVLAITTFTNEIRVVRISEIGYFRYSTRRKVWEVALTDGSFLTLHKGTSAGTILGYNSAFVQTHQSYIVNVNSVMLIGANTVQLFPPFNDDMVRLGRIFRKKLQDMFILI